MDTSGLTDDPGPVPTPATGAEPGEGPGPQEPSRPPRLSRSSVRSILEWIVVIVAAVAIALLVRSFLFQVFSIPSESMVPTLEPGDRVLVNRLDDEPSRGDIVVFRRPDTWVGQHEDIIKRVIALGGETVEAHDGIVSINGAPMDEPYLSADVRTGDFGPTVVPEGEVFVMGDNRNFSLDSRENGPVPEDRIVGRAILVIWPVARIGRI